MLGLYLHCLCRACGRNKTTYTPTLFSTYNVAVLETHNSTEIQCFFLKKRKVCTLGYRHECLSGNLLMLVEP